MPGSTEGNDRYPMNIENAGSGEPAFTRYEAEDGIRTRDPLLGKQMLYR
jgi:hypothetical protein